MKPFLLAVSLLLSSQLLANDVTEERIVYIKDTTEIWAYGEIWTATPDGSDQRLLWDDSQEDLATFALLSPDGRWLFYQSQKPNESKRTAHLRNLVTGQEFEYRYFVFHGTQWLLDSSGLVATANNDCRSYLPVLFSLDGSATELSNPDLGQKGHHVFGVGIETNTFFVLIQDCVSSSGPPEIQKFNFQSGTRQFVGTINSPVFFTQATESSLNGEWIYFEGAEQIGENYWPSFTERFSMEDGTRERVFDFAAITALSPDGTEMLRTGTSPGNRIHSIANQSYRDLPIEGRVTDWSFLVTSAPPVFHKFKSSQTVVAIGESFDLHWEVGDASECNGLGDWSGAKGVEGSETITVNTVGPKLYQLSCTNLLNETRSQTISIEVQASWEDCVPANIYLTNQSEVDALSVTECTVVTGSLRISGSDITSLEGLSKLTGVSGNMSISSNVALTSLDGLSNLTHVGWNLSVSNNGALTSLEGLYKLNSVGGDMEIQSNAVLTSLDGLSSLTSLGTDLRITGNPKLDQCSAVSRLLDQWDDAEPGPGPGVGGFPDIGGEVDIGNNLGGCNSVEEVLATVDPSKINAGLNDAWYYPETSGQGFFITVFPDLGYVSLAWFTYDTELPPIDAQANLGDPGHRWLTAVGQIEGNQVHMDIEMTSGGIFDSATEIVRTDPPGSDGTILLTFDSCNSGTVEYDIPSINRQGIVPIRRVADDKIVLCEALNSN